MHGSPGKKMTAREKNDLLLGLMKADGSDLGQKTDGTPRFVRIQEEQGEAIEAAKKAEAAAKAAKQKAKEEARIKKLAEKRERELERNKKQIRLDKKLAKEAERMKRAAMYGNDGRTEYSRQRSRRKTSSRFKGDSDTTLQFVNCRNYDHNQKQPFTVDVSIEATLLIDLLI